MILALVDDQNRLIMDWSAKAGCTIVTKMFLRHMGLLVEAEAYDAWVHNYREQVFYRTHRTTMDKLRDPEYFKFKVVRNPFARATSSYIYAMYNDFFVDQRTGKLADMSFHEFVDVLERIDIRRCNMHLAQQKKDYEYEIPSVFNVICRLEDIQLGLALVNAATGLTLSVDGLGSDHHTKREDETGECIADEPWSRIKDRLGDYRFFYTDDLIKKIRTIYADDCSSYGYEWGTSTDSYGRHLEPAFS
ncbi:MAG: sulfotransferase family 2 domain-containing protein [Gammaproteobacteria bacterium]|nr:sulfotransferase family 2 domain-containing protein [Gammaproteobacteria bacterium]